MFVSLTLGPCLTNHKPQWFPVHASVFSRHTDLLPQSTNTLHRLSGNSKLPLRCACGCVALWWTGIPPLHWKSAGIRLINQLCLFKKYYTKTDKKGTSLHFLKQLFVWILKDCWRTWVQNYRHSENCPPSPRSCLYYHPRVIPSAHSPLCSTLCESHANGAWPESAQFTLSFLQRW